MNKLFVLSLIYILLQGSVLRGEEHKTPISSEMFLNAVTAVEKKEFVEVFLDTPIGICEKRDPKGLYKKARSGLIKDFTGIDSAYEKPEDPEIILDGSQKTPEDLSEEIISFLLKNNIID